MIYTSPFSSTPAATHLSIFDTLFTHNASLDPSAIALIDSTTSSTTTYASLITDSLRIGHGLTYSAGLKKGSTILIFSPNSVLYPALLFGGCAAGVTVSTANNSYTPKELSHQLGNSGAEVMLCSSDLVDVAREAAKLVRGFSEDRIYVLPGADGRVETQGLRSWVELRGDPEFKPVEWEEDELEKSIAFLPYSSGTTSAPKGVSISHANITRVSQQLNSVQGLFDKPEIVMGCLPVYHIFGLVILLMQTLANGGTIVLMPKFELVGFCEAVQKYKTTVALIVPPIALGLSKHPIVDKYDLSSLRFFMCGAAPLSAHLQLTLEKRLKGKTHVLQGYGMTESTSVALLPDINDFIPGTVGKLISGGEARLVGEDGKDVKEGERGELWIRGPNIMVGYHNNLKATKDTINDEGWLMTGDICTRSQTGHFEVVDRMKELIKYSGLQVAPASLEAILLTCPFVADAAVIGVWSEERATELPRAYVVLEAGHANDKGITDRIQEFVTGKVAHHMKLRGGVVVIDVIPKSPSGKILRKDLRVLAATEDKKTVAKL